MNFLGTIFLLLILFILYLSDAYFHLASFKQEESQLFKVGELERKRLNQNTYQRYSYALKKEKYRYKNGGIPFSFVKDNPYQFERLLRLCLSDTSYAQNLNIHMFSQTIVSSFLSSKKTISKTKDLAKLDLGNTEYQKALYFLLKTGKEGLISTCFTFKEEKINLLRSPKEVYNTLFDFKTADFLWQQHENLKLKYKKLSQEERQIHSKKLLEYSQKDLQKYTTLFSEQVASDFCVLEFPPNI